MHLQQCCFRARSNCSIRDSTIISHMTYKMDRSQELNATLICTIGYRSSKHSDTRSFCEISSPDRIIHQVCLITEYLQGKTEMCQPVCMLRYSHENAAHDSIRSTNHFTSRRTNHPSHQLHYALHHPRPFLLAIPRLPPTMCFYHAYSFKCGHTNMVLQQLCGKGQMKQQKCARGQDGTILATVKVETPCSVCPS
jgi:hypothetical protein